MDAVVCKKEIFKLNLPKELLLEVLTYCVWTRPLRSSLWYIVASRFDTTCLTRAKQTDQALQYLASDEYDDCCYVFKRTSPELFDYLHHIENNRTV
jgi:hypothetical protein